MSNEVNRGRELLLSQLKALNDKLSNPQRRTGDAVEGNFTAGQYVKGIKELSEAAAELISLEERLKVKGGSDGLRRRKTKSGTDSTSASV